jgi:hypothetical protein
MYVYLPLPSTLYTPHAPFTGYDVVLNFAIAVGSVVNLRSDLLSHLLLQVSVNTAEDMFSQYYAKVSSNTIQLLVSATISKYGTPLYAPTFIFTLPTTTTVLSELGL